MKKIELLFYQTSPSEENTGMKHVLWEVTDPQGIIKYDWGFGYWDGSAWQDIDTPSGFTTTVYSWANTANPDLLTKEKGKIITLGK